LPAFTTLPVDPLTGAIGRCSSGAPLYHRGSVFGPPERRKLDRNMRTRILYLAIALDADSDDVARSFRDHVARCSDMMSPA
jgi:hypothetical protein